MSDYETDVVVWSVRQSALLRRIASGEQINDQVDWPNIIEEVDTVGRSERSALSSHIGTVLEHLMKLVASPAVDPRSGWENSILHARGAIKRSLKYSPSLRPEVAALIADETPDAQETVSAAMRRYREQPRVDIDSLTFTEDQVLGDWWPPT